METPLNNDKNTEDSPNIPEADTSNPITYQNEPKKERLIDSLFKRAKSPAEEVIIQPLRTYEDDIKDAISNQSMSTARIVMAEQQKRTAELEEEINQDIATPKNQIFLILTVLLIVISIGVAGYFFFIKDTLIKQEFEPTIIIDRPQFITVESQEEIVVQNRSILNVASDITRTLKTPIEPKTMREILLTNTRTVGSGEEAKEQKVALTTEQFFILLNTRSPETLVRSLGKDFMMGMYNTPDYNDLFTIFAVTDFDNAYASMLKWETDLGSDLQIIFKSLDERNIPKIQSPVNENTASSTATTTVNTGTNTGSVGTSTTRVGTSTVSNTTTATSTNTVVNASSTTTTGTTTAGAFQQTSLRSFNPRLFEDLVVSNRDLRTIVRRDNSLVFYYSFIDEETLLFATHPDTIGELITRLRSNRLLNK